MSGIYRSAQFKEIIYLYLKTGFCDLICAEILAIYGGSYSFKTKATFLAKVLSFLQKFTLNSNDRFSNQENLSK